MGRRTVVFETTYRGQGEWPRLFKPFWYRRCLLTIEKSIRFSFARDRCDSRRQTCSALASPVKVPLRLVVAIVGSSTNSVPVRSLSAQSCPGSLALRLARSSWPLPSSNGVDQGSSRWPNPTNVFPSDRRRRQVNASPTAPTSSNGLVPASVRARLAVTRPDRRSITCRS